MQKQDPGDPTGVSGDGKSGRKALVRSRSRKASAALDLKLAGYSWSDIAETLGYPTGRQALVAVEQELERELDTVDREKLRLFAGRRLETLLTAVWPAAIDPNNPNHMAAQGRAHMHIDRWIKLNGLDAPAEVIIHTPTTNEIEAFVARVMADQTPDVVEADVIDGEVLSDVST